MAIPQSIETDRLVLRRHLRADATAVALLLDDWDVVKWLAQVPYPYTEKEALEWITRTQRNWAEGKEYQLGVALRPGGTLIGHIGLRLETARRSAEVGYWLGQAHWGRGYATEAARAMVRFAFEALAVDRVWATCLPDNQRSLEVLRKAGLSLEGTRSQIFATRSAPVDVPLLGLDRPAWAAVAAAPCGTAP